MDRKSTRSSFTQTMPIIKPCTIKCCKYNNVVSESENSSTASSEFSYNVKRERESTARLRHKWKTSEGSEFDLSEPEFDPKDPDYDPSDDTDSECESIQSKSSKRRKESRGKCVDTVPPIDIDLKPDPIHKYTCTTCRLTFINSNSLQNHHRLNPQCHGFFYRIPVPIQISQAQSTRRSHSAKIRYKCRECEIMLNNFEESKNHYEKCGYTLDLEYPESIQKIQVGKFGRFKCTKCSERFETRQGRSIHIQRMHQV